MNEDVFKDPPQLETERLLFRQIDTSHTQLMFEFNSDLEALRFVPRAPYTSIEQATDKVAEFETGYKERTGFGWAFHLKDSSEPIGYGGFFNVSGEDRKAEIGYGLLPGYWGLGYASEAAAEIVRFGFHDLGLHRIYGLVDPENAASVRLIEKLGFSKEGQFKDDAFARGRYFDMCVFALINPRSE
jgi:ribosomal-protein-alanine N-acetyltransferase